MHPNETFLTKFKTKEEGQKLVQSLTEEALAMMSASHLDALSEQLKRLDILPEIQDTTPRVIGEINGMQVYDS
jgi:hypothetical protein